MDATPSTAKNADQTLLPSDELPRIDAQTTAIVVLGIQFLKRESTAVVDVHCTTE